MSTQFQESRTSTVRLSFPNESLKDSIKNMKIIGGDLLLYVSEDQVESVTQFYSNLGFTTVDRVFKLHVSTQDEQSFTRIFGDVTHEVRETTPRFITTLSLTDKDEYDKLLALHGNDCVVKPFKFRYSSLRSTDQDDASDTNERVQYNRTQYTQQKRYDNQNGSSTGKPKFTRQQSQSQHQQPQQSQQSQRSNKSSDGWTKVNDTRSSRPR